MPARHFAGFRNPRLHTTIELLSLGANGTQAVVAERARHTLWYKRDGISARPTAEPGQSRSGGGAVSVDIKRGRRAIA